MTSRLVLITGGAGFIGSHLADELLRARPPRARPRQPGEPQVHGEGAAARRTSTAEVELRVGDVRDPDAVERALDGVDAVYHFAATVGVGQSMYELARLHLRQRRRHRRAARGARRAAGGRLVVASSMSVYGEGLYRDRRRPPGDDAGPSARAAAPARLGGPRRDGRAAAAGADAGEQAARARVGLRALQVRPGAAVPHGRRGVRHPRPWRCASSTCTARARRSRTPTPASSRSSRRGS